MRSILIFLLALLVMAQAGANAALSPEKLSIELPQIVLTEVPFTAHITIDPASTEAESEVRLEINGVRFAPTARNSNKLTFSNLTVTDSGRLAVSIIADGIDTMRTTVGSLPGWLSVLPPIVGILFALMFRSVVPALFLGTWTGAWLLTGMTLPGIGTSVLAVFDVYVREALSDSDHAAIILFSLMIGGMVGIIFKNGGMEGVVALSRHWAKTPRQGQIATAALGTALFFDDYSNTLVVGNAMRPVTDRLLISREKLAFLVDATAAPIACIALVTTWVGYEVGLIDAAIKNLDGFDQAPYLIYLRSIGYSFYPLLMMVFVFMIAASGRDFGPMATAERRARAGQPESPATDPVEMAEAKGLEPGAETPRRAVNAVVPIVTLIAGVLIGLYVTGSGASLMDIIGSADPYRALMWASLVATLVAGALTLSQRLLSLEATIMAWCAGIKMMMLAMIVLILAWSLASLTAVLHTADFLVLILGDTIPVGLVPGTVFIVAAATSFATGTSWGTMGLLFPVVVPLSWAILVANGVADPEHYHILYSSIACVLSGAVWGDHCSPISDTTILSSMSSRCNHIDHVMTQLPYALSVGTVALVVGTIPAGYGLPWWMMLCIGAACLAILLFVLGRPSTAPSAAGSD